MERDAAARPLRRDRSGRRRLSLELPDLVRGRASRTVPRLRVQLPRHGNGCRHVSAGHRGPREVSQSGQIRRRNHRAIAFAYEVLRAGDGLLLAEGETHHIVMNSQGRARAFPPKYAEMMKNGNV